MSIKCVKCKKLLDESEFHKSSARGYQPYCKNCEKEFTREWRHRTGKQLPISDNKTCATYLGIYISERVLSNYFEDVVQMPYGNKGFDFICKNGFKIDAKSSCMYKKIKYQGECWKFNINRNKTADYFLLVAFNNRTDLTPLHIWLVPSEKISKLSGLTIYKSQLVKWSVYEKPLDKVIECCNVMRGV